MKTETNEPSNTTSWDGYTLEELSHKRQVAKIKIMVQRDHIANDVETVLNGPVITQKSGSNIMSGIFNQFSVFQYAVMGVKFGKFIYKRLHRKQNK